MVLTMSVVTLALMMLLSLAVPATAAAAYSMLAIIETESRGPLDCGNRARGFEGTDVLYGLSDELAAPGTDTMTGGTAAARPIVIRKPSTCSSTCLARPFCLTAAPQTGELGDAEPPWF